MAKKKTMTCGYLLVEKKGYLIREKASKDSNALGHVEKGDKLAYLGKTDKGWHKVEKSGTVGWVYKQAGKLTVVEQKYLTVKKGSWHVRSAPGKTAASMGIVKGGEKLLDQGEIKTVYRLVIYNNQYGWVSNRAIEKE